MALEIYTLTGLEIRELRRILEHVEACPSANGMPEQTYGVLDHVALMLDTGVELSIVYDGPE